MKAICLVGNLIRKNEAEALEALGHSVVKMPPSTILPHPMCTHTVMLVFIGFGCLFTHRSYYNQNHELIDKISNERGLDIVVSDEELGISYPNDVLFNAVCIGSKLICNQKYISKHILDKAKNSGCEVILTKQGYTKCSTCVVSDNAIITADRGIYAVAISNGIDSLLIEPGHISLPPYEYGFIGGASGRYGDKVYFCGDINKHPSSKEILAFLKNHGKEAVSLSNSELLDIGSILFV